MTITSLTKKLTSVPSLSVNFTNFYNSLLKALLLPMIGITIFLMLWTMSAKSIHTSLGDFPGPSAVYQQFHSLYDEHIDERAKADKFYLRQESRNVARVEDDSSYVPKIRKYTGKETFFDQIITSLITVSSGF